MTDADKTSRGLATPITAERKPIAAKAKKVAEKSPERRRPPIGRKLLATDRYQRDADRRERNRGDQGERRRIVERDEAGRGHEAHEEDRRERQSEQESHLRRADRSEHADQIALRRVAQRMGAIRSEQRHWNPNRSEDHGRDLPLPWRFRSAGGRVGWLDGARGQHRQRAILRVHIFPRFVLPYESVRRKPGRRHRALGQTPRPASG